MNHTTVAPENQVSSQEALQQATAEKAHTHQFSLVCRLKELYALVNVCRLALHGHGQDETDSTNSVLMLVTNSLFELYEQEKTREKALAAIAYPDWVEGGDA